MDLSAFQAVKLTLIGVTGLSKDALHVYVGLTVFLLAALAARKPLHSPLPLLCVLLVACAGEALDLSDDIRSAGRWNGGASLHDVIHTTFWPLVLFALARWTALFARREP